MSRAFENVPVGSWSLPQRFVMAPLTRNRAGEGMVPTDLAATYYGQRAGAGLIVTEGTQPSAVGQGYLNTPGIHSAEQVEGWRKVADAVHADGGRIVVQLMHVGRIAHPDNKQGLETVAPSAIPAPGKMVTAHGQVDHVTPRALETSELPGIVEEFVQAVAQRDRRRAGRGRGALRQRLPAPPVPRPLEQHPHRRVRRLARRPRPAHRRGDPRGGRGDRRRQGRHPDLPRPQHPGCPGGGRGGDPRRPTRRSSTASRDLGLAYLSILADPEAKLVADLRERFGGPLVLNSGFAEMTTLEDVESVLSTRPGRPGRRGPPVPGQPGPRGPVADRRRAQRAGPARPSTAAAPRATPTTRSCPPADPAHDAPTVHRAPAAWWAVAPAQLRGTTSAAPRRAASAVSSSGICWLSRSASTRLR